MIFRLSVCPSVYARSSRGLPHRSNRADNTHPVAGQGVCLWLHFTRQQVSGLQEQVLSSTRENNVNLENGGAELSLLVPHREHSEL